MTKEDKPIYNDPSIMWTMRIGKVWIIESAAGGRVG